LFFSLSRKGVPYMAGIVLTVVPFILGEYAICTGSARFTSALFNSCTICGLGNYLVQFSCFIAWRHYHSDIYRAYTSPFGVIGATIGIMSFIIALVAMIVYTPNILDAIITTIVIISLSFIYFFTYARHRLQLSPEEIRALFPIQTLESTLKNEEIRKAFILFLQEDHSSENLAFWEEVNKLRSLKGTEWKEAALRLYDLYASPSSATSVNLAHNIRHRITENIALVRSGQEIKDIYDTAQKEVYLLMSTDPFPRFIRDGAKHFETEVYIPPKRESQGLDNSIPTIPKRESQGLDNSAPPLPRESEENLDNSNVPLPHDIPRSSENVESLSPISKNNITPVTEDNMSFVL